MSDIVKAILYGIVEGITEWIPVSSTGHMILFNEFVRLKQSEEFFSVFLVVIQLGAILAVVIMFWNRLWPFARTSNNPDPVRKKGILSCFVKSRWVMWAKIFIACIPAAVIGVLFDDVFDELFYNPTCVAVALIVFGIALIVVESVELKNSGSTRSIDDITFRQAFAIGCWQLIAAIFPGTSRMPGGRLASRQQLKRLENGQEVAGAERPDGGGGRARRRSARHQLSKDHRRGAAALQDGADRRGHPGGGLHPGLRPGHLQLRAGFL